MCVCVQFMCVHVKDDKIKPFFLTASKFLPFSTEASSFTELQAPSTGTSPTESQPLSASSTGSPFTTESQPLSTGVSFTESQQFSSGAFSFESQPPSTDKSGNEQKAPTPPPIEKGVI